MSHDFIANFGDGQADGRADDGRRLGGKGANLAEMTRLGIPVPPGFTITTDACLAYLREGRSPDGLAAQVDEAIALLERRQGLQFGDAEKPLLVSVRSGAAVSMPGMMDTVLNLGLNDATIAGHAARADARFAWDCYRRFVQMYANVVLGMDTEPMERAITELKRDEGVQLDTELSAEHWQQLTGRFRQLVREATGRDFPQDPREQLSGAIAAVFDSWNNERAVTYRRLNRIPADLGTAVNVQAMVFGNMGEGCATGVGFTRDPKTGERRFFGEWLPNAQGEDVVAGTRTPFYVSAARGGEDSLEKQMPEAHARLDQIQKVLEEHYRDMQDVEFTIQHGELYLLQTRTGKRTGPAAVRMAVEMVAEGLIDEDEAVRRVDANSLEQLLKPAFCTTALDEAQAQGRRLAQGLDAGPGAASGRIALSAESAVRMAATGPVLLVRTETSPEDIEGMAHAQGILTARGGATSHAALVARQMGKPCVAGCSALDVRMESQEVHFGHEVLREGDPLSIDGTTGWVYAGEIDTEPSEIHRVAVDGSLAPEDSGIWSDYSQLMSWADERRRLKVRTNADTPASSAEAVALGAEGIGLTRTEHMFFEEHRIRDFREMILATDEEHRRAALDKMRPHQREDFAGIFRAMAGRPATIRLLDPPLHEFLPHDEKQQRDLAEEMGLAFEELQAGIERLSESNPMLGHRGCRLAITYPEICEMQSRAILEAACDVAAEGVEVHPEIMVPLVGEVAELRLLSERIRETADAVLEERGMQVPYLVGTMIEVPRAALTAGSIAEVAEFFSFGTNDLTQMTWGLSRDDTAGLLAEYRSRGVLDFDPFQSIDPSGVGRLVRLAVEEGRAQRDDLKLGICGEHGGDAVSVHFFHAAGLDYVSCSPPRVPTARLAAAQAALQDE